MTTINLFGELRSVLSDSPSEAGFKKVWGLLEKVSQEDLERIYIPYCQEHMASWPVTTCVVAGTKDLSDPRYALARHLDWSDLGINEPPLPLRDPLNLATQILKLPHTTRIAYLDFCDSYAEGSELLPVFKMCREQLQYLEKIDLLCTDFDDDCAAALATLPETTPLRHLNLSSTSITNESIRFLASAQCLSHLRSLDLMMTDGISEGCLPHLAGAVFKESLQSLDILDCRFADESLSAFFKANPFPNLKSLTFGHISYRADALFLFYETLRTISLSPWAESLLFLDLHPLTQEVCALIEYSPYFSDQLKAKFARESL